MDKFEIAQGRHLANNKIYLADLLVKTVDSVRVARHEVSELNSKSDSEKELYCYSAILKAEANVERCKLFLAQHKSMKAGN